MCKKFLFPIFFSLVFLFSIGSTAQNLKPGTPDQLWADSIMTTLSLDEKLGQLFMVAAYSNKGNQHEKDLEHLIKNEHVGGLIFFQGGPGRQAALTNKFQQAAGIPLLIAMDAEWGLGMRLDSTMDFPKQMTLGAIQDEHLIYDMGVEIGRQCNRLGVHVNFAPVVDINVNPANPVIGVRSFGEDKVNVALKGRAYMHGLQDKKVIATAKHFPGHGDTDVDSHKDLPVIKHPVERLKKVEQFPFKVLIDDSLGAIMVAHLHMPAYDDTENRATTLSPKVVTGLLQDSLGFNGLIFTDALNMKGVSKFFEPGEINVQALKAGNDVLLFPVDVNEAKNKIKKALKKGEIEQEDVDAHVHKILRAKYWVGLKGKAEHVEVKNIAGELDNAKAKALNQTLYESAITVVADKGNTLPYSVTEGKTYASLMVGDKSETFDQYLNQYATFDNYTTSGKRLSEEEKSVYLNKLSEYDRVVIGVNSMNNSLSRNFGINQALIDFTKALQLKSDVVLVLFGNPYALKNFSDIDHLICAYEDNEYTFRAAPEVIFGAVPALGQLPVSAGPFKEGEGIILASNGTIKHGFPEQEGMNSEVLVGIDSIMDRSIQDKATPGARILVVKNGRLVVDKNYGYLTYDSINPVQSNTLYDLASVTKVASTTLSLMKLHEENCFRLEDTIGLHMTDLRGTNKSGMRIKDILTHQAGLIPWLPFWTRTASDGEGLSSSFYCNRVGDSVYCNMVTPGLYSVSYMEDSIWTWIKSSQLRRKNPVTDKYNYRYSDLGFYMLKRLVENLTYEPIDQFVYHEFYKPMGLRSISFNPLMQHSRKIIAPTENDLNFRNSLIWGTVHDQGAAMIGGVGGHAGLFSNAYDLAALMQMIMQNGTYSGKSFFKDSTLVQTFTSKAFEDNRRGLGWDKPEENPDLSPASKYASKQSFGHTGFTGTMVWADPKYDLVYIFLSNRVYPDAENNRLLYTNVRTKVHDVIYSSFLDIEDKQ